MLLPQRYYTDSKKFKIFLIFSLDLSLDCLLDLNLLLLNRHDEIGNSFVLDQNLIPFVADCIDDFVDHFGDRNRQSNQ